VADVTSDLARSNQPPLGFTAPANVVTGCVGTMADGGCHGSLRFPLGTNRQGIGMGVVVVRGMGVSLRVALVVGALVVPLALLVGSVAGYLGGWVDAVVMRYVDVQATVPAFLVYIVLTFALGRSLFLLVVVFGLLSWGGVARVVRSEVMRLRQAAFVDAAEVHGAGHLFLLGRHVLPNLTGTLATAVTQRIPAILLTEAAISFLLLNDTSVPSWGFAISTGFRAQSPFLDLWWISTVPLVFLTLTVVSVTVLGDALRDVLDERTET
jgi:peptide/nickel transport system permease protein